MATRMKMFEDFWKWLSGGPYRVKNLGCEQGKSFEIKAQGADGYCIPVSTGKKHPFTKDQARRVWDRFHGAWAASQVFGDDVHLRAGAYAQPNKRPSPTSWTECPNQICAPWIAAAIAEYLGIHPCSKSNKNFRPAQTTHARQI